jgi:hypothetical protein
MPIRNHVRTLALASALVFSTVSPLAVHTYAAENQGSGSNASVPGDCTADQGYQSADGKTNYAKGDNIPQGTKVHAVDPNGNVNQNATYKCDNGKVVVALVFTQPTVRHLPVAPAAGAIFVP